MKNLFTRAAIIATYSTLVYVATLIAVATAVLPLFAVDWWWVRIGDFPRLQLLIAYGAVMVFLLPMIRRRMARVAMVAIGFACAIQLVWIYDYLPIATKQVQDARQGESDNHVRVMSANVLQTNTNHKALLKLIETHSPRDTLARNPGFMRGRPALDRRHRTAGAIICISSHPTPGQRLRHRALQQLAGALSRSPLLCQTRYPVD